MKHLSIPGESSTALVRITDENGNQTTDEAVHGLEGGQPLRKMSAVKTNLTRFSKSFRDQAHHVRHAIQKEAKKVRKVPRWVRWSHTLYHDWGLKHLCLILVLIIYNFIGAAVFYYAEASHDESQEVIWKDDIAKNRTRFVDAIVPTMFNNTDYLFFLTGEQTAAVKKRLKLELGLYEVQLGVKYKPDQKIKWDFWNAMLYAQTLCTTIGDAQLYTVTVFGRVFTMVYATFGIPLVLSVLDDMGKILTKCLKTPWWLIKCACRRMFRYCTKQSLEEIKKLDEEDRHDLEVFDLPIPIAVFVVVAWIFICSATFCIWEEDWDYFTAFYFFFICLSTIGLGDITPSQPKFFLLLFIYIIIGLSLASMCLNLIQTRMKRTYDVGRQQFDNLSSGGGSDHRLNHAESFTRPARRRGSSLGVFRGCGSSYSLSRDAVQALLSNRQKCNKSSQTVLSFPSPSKNNLHRAVDNSRMKFFPRTLSIDDVMKLVDTEEGDILLLTELTKEESGITTSSTNTDDLSDSQVVVSKSFDAHFAPSTFVDQGALKKASTMSAPVQGSTAVDPDAELVDNVSILIPRLRTNTYTLQQLEAQEEEEDRMALGSFPLESSSVHFRSRLSLIPEAHSVIDEDGEQSTPDTDSELSSKRSSTGKHSISEGRASRTSNQSGGSGSGIASKISTFIGRRRSNASTSSK